MEYKFRYFFSLLIKLYKWSLEINSTIAPLHDALITELQKTDLNFLIDPTLGVSKKVIFQILLFIQQRRK